MKWLCHTGRTGSGSRLTTEHRGISRTPCWGQEQAGVWTWPARPAGPAPELPPRRALSSRGRCSRWHSGAARGPHAPPPRRAPHTGHGEGGCQCTTLTPKAGFGKSVFGPLAGPRGRHTQPRATRGGVPGVLCVEGRGPPGVGRARPATPAKQLMASRPAEAARRPPVLTLRLSILRQDSSSLTVRRGRLASGFLGGKDGGFVPPEALTGRTPAGKRGRSLTAPPRRVRAGRGLGQPRIVSVGGAPPSLL